jgi:spore germination protein GerM
VILYFIDSNGHLFPAITNVATPVSIASILDALMNGPSNNANLQTQIPPGTQVLSAGVSQGLVTVDLTSGIESASGEPLIQAFAQLVFTATPVSCPAPPKKTKSKKRPPPTTTTASVNRTPVLPCADRVVFEVDGQRLEVPIDTGAQTGRPVTRADYSTLSS